MSRQKPLNTMDDADRECIDILLDKHRQTAIFQKWMWVESNSNKPNKQRLIIITNTRVFAVKRGPMKRRQVRHSYPIVELRELQVADRFHKEEDMKRVKLGFHSHDDPLTIVASEADTKIIVKCVLLNSRIITHGHPDHRMPILNVDEKFLDGCEKPEIASSDAVLRGYEVGCDFLEIPQKFDVIKNLKSLVDTDQSPIPFRLKTIFPGSPIDPSQIQSVALSVQYTDFFDEVDAANCPLGDDGLASLAIALAGNIYINSVDISQCKAGFVGIYRLAKHLKSVADIPLQKLIVSRNKIGDAGMEELSLHLTERPVDVFGASQCGFHQKGYKSLANLCMSPVWLENLQLLDISGNGAGKSGTKALAKYLDVATNLRVLTATRCHLDCGILFESLERNTRLWKDGLTSLNISGNKLGLNESACESFANILAQTNTLATVAMAHVKFSKTTFEMIIKGVLSNQSYITFALDIRGNDLQNAFGEVFGEQTKQLIQQTQVTQVGIDGLEAKITNIKTLILSGNNFGVDGTIVAARGLEDVVSLQNLVLDRNIPQNAPEDRTSAVEAIAKLMQQLPNLRMLSLQGSPGESSSQSYALSTALNPVLNELQTNQSLTRLDISGNKLFDEGVETLAQALVANEESNLEIINLADNKITGKGVHSLLKCVRARPLLTQVKITNTPEQLPQELRGPFEDLEKALEENRNHMQSQPPKLHLRSPTTLLGFRNSQFGQGPSLTRSTSFSQVSRRSSLSESETSTDYRPGGGDGGIDGDQDLGGPSSPQEQYKSFGTRDSDSDNGDERKEDIGSG